MLLRVEEEHEVGLELLRGAGARVVELRREGPDAAQGVRAHLSKLPKLEEFCRMFANFWRAIVLACIKTKICKKICV